MIGKAGIILDAMVGGRILRYRDLPGLGVGPATLTRLVKSGVVIDDDDGRYRLAGTPEPAPLQMLAAAYPDGVLCLLTAQRLHGLVETSEQHYSVAVPRSASRHKGTSVPGIQAVKLVSWREPGFYTVGIATTPVGGGMKMRVTDRWRTVADMFRREHRQDMEQAHKALAIVAREDGREGLRKVSAYARKLGYGAAVSPKTAALAEFVESPHDHP